MPRYRKKPVEIEAVDATDIIRNIRHYPNSLPDWVNTAYLEGNIVLINNLEGGVVMINTLEGSMFARDDDMIIQGVNGEIQPCRKDIFEDTYELVI